MKKIAVFASGGGSNAQKIYDYFKGNNSFRINTIVCNNLDAGILERSKDWGAEQIHIERKDFYETDALAKHLLNEGIDLVVLAGFLWLIPTSLLEAFPNKIVNIHPALLPNYGGKGMYGMNVHKAVFENKEQFSGATIHYINEEYDKGAFIEQQKVDISNCKSPEEVAAAVLKVEHEYFPRVIDQLLFSND